MSSILCDVLLQIGFNFNMSNNAFYFYMKNTFAINCKKMFLFLVFIAGFVGLFCLFVCLFEHRYMFKLAHNFEPGLFYDPL